MRSLPAAVRVITVHSPALAKDGPSFDVFTHATITELSPVAVPEPANLALVAAPLLGLIRLRRIHTAA